MFKLAIEFSDAGSLKDYIDRMTGSAAASTDTTTKPKATAGKTAAPAKAAVPDFKTEVSPLILQLADKSRDKAVALLAQFNVKKGAELKPEQYADFIVAANAAIASVEDDLG